MYQDSNCPNCIELELIEDPNKARAEQVARLLEVEKARARQQGEQK